MALVARGVTVERGDRLILADVDITLTERSRLAVVGPNGVGKSTLFQVLAGTLAPDRGSVQRAPATLSVGLLRQELDRSAAETVRNTVAAAVGITAAEQDLEDATTALATGASGADDRYVDALEAWTRLGAADFDTRLVVGAADIGLEARLLDVHPATLSGGQAARVGLLTVMLSRFDITLLDEPTNDLDVEGLEMLEAWVDAHLGGLAVISHDRTFLERTVDSVLEIDENRHTAMLFGGGWEAFLEERARARAHAQEAYEDYVTERDRLRRRAQRQREWADQGASRANKHPADGDKHRRAHNLAQTEKLVGKAKATQRAIDRLVVVDKPWEGWDLRFSIDRAPRSGKVVAALDRAVIQRGSWTLGPVDLEVHRGERVALVGRNGSGKTSLIDALLGRQPVASGSAMLGAGVVVGELDQRRARFVEGDDTLLEVFMALTGQSVSEARSVLAKFGLTAAAVDRSAASLSPGERTRAQLAHFQAAGVNFLVLDEPTNHLDLPATEQLESALASYDGTLLLVTHDRRMLENVDLTRSIVLEDLA